MATVGVFELTAGTVLASGDVLPFVDVSNTTQSPQGSLLKITLANFLLTLPSATNITSASATSLAVGRLGATTPAFSVDSSTGTQVAGLKVTGAATGGTVAVVATDSGADASLSINSKGAGTLILQTGLTVGVGIYAAPAANIDLQIKRATGTASLTPLTIRLHSTNSAADWSTTVNWASLEFYSDDISTGPNVQARIGVRMFSAAGADSNIVLSPTNGAGTLVDTLVVQAATTAGIYVTGIASVTSAGATALAVGPSGVTNPSFLVDASTASAATGLKVKSAAAAGGLALSVITSGTNENLTLDAAGSGTITLAGTSTGNITLGTNFTVQRTSGAAIIQQARLRGSALTSVTGATSILTLSANTVALLVVTGSDGTNKFGDVVLFLRDTNPVVISTNTDASAPAARTYTRSGNDLQLAMASGTYNVGCASVDALYA